MSENKSNSSAGVTTLGILGVAFTVLKLTKVITWSWWWVTAPFWIPALIALAALITFLVFFRGKI